MVSSGLGGGSTKRRKKRKEKVKMEGFRKTIAKIQMTGLKMTFVE